MIRHWDAYSADRPKIQEHRMMDIQHHQDADSHEQQCQGKQRIDLANDLIDGNSVART